MIRLFWFLIQIGVLAAATLWLAQNPGTVAMEWLDYDIEMPFAVFAFGALVALVALVIVYRLLKWIVFLPWTLIGLYKKKNSDKGLDYLTSGFASLAAGDIAGSEKYAKKAHKALPEKAPMPLLLLAQIERKKGHAEKAEEIYRQLLAHKSSAFLGARGLLASALEKGDSNEALIRGRKALEMHPKQPAILVTVFKLEIEMREWQIALETLKRIEKVKALPVKQIASHKAAIYLLNADKYLEAGETEKARDLLEKAWKTKAHIVPVAQRLSDLYRTSGQRKKAVRVLEKAWIETPHPDLVPVWERLQKQVKKDRTSHTLKWYERLVSLRPDSMEGQLAAAKACLKMNAYNEAQAYLTMAERLKPSVKVYRLWAEFEELAGRKEVAQDYLLKMAEAPLDPVWYCAETGQTFEQWQPLVPPQGRFDTMQWGPLAKTTPSHYALEKAGVSADLLIGSAV